QIRCCGEAVHRKAAEHQQGAPAEFGDGTQAGQRSERVRQQGNEKTNKAAQRCVESHGKPQQWVGRVVERAGGQWSNSGHVETPWDIGSNTSENADRELPDRRLALPSTAMR